MKYLVIDSAEQEPICITDNPDEYGYGYAVWEYREDGTFDLYKETEAVFPVGMALYYWDSCDSSYVEEQEPTIIEKYPGKWSDDFSEEFIEELVRQAGFVEEKPQVIQEWLLNHDYYSEELADGKLMVFGRYYRDGSFDTF